MANLAYHANKVATKQHLTLNFYAHDMRTAHLTGRIKQFQGILCVPLIRRNGHHMHVSQRRMLNTTNVFIIVIIQLIMYEKQEAHAPITCQ